MKGKIKNILFVLFLVILIVYISLAYIPRSYDVPSLKQRSSTKYWELPTGSTIAYTLLEGKGIKRPSPILFLQGGPGGYISERNISMLSPLIDLGYDVYLYDQVGSGFSERLENIKEYTAERHTLDLEEIIKKIGSEKVILIGQSWGAILATLYLADHKDKIEKLILTGPGPIFPVNMELANIQAPDSLHLTPPLYTNRQANESANNLRSTTIKQWAEWFGIKLASDEEADQFQTYLNNKLNKAIVCDTSNALKADCGAGYYVHIMTMKSLQTVEDTRPRLKGCKVPLLIMKGQCDNQKWGFITEYLALFPDHKLVVVPNAGHSVSIEQPEIYKNAITDFLR